MGKNLLLLVALCLATFVYAGCNGARIDNPSGTTLPGSGTEGMSDTGNIDANYALDLIPEREIPISIPIDDPDWDPLFDSLTESGKCIPEGCLTVELEQFVREEEPKADFKATFFNPNSDDFDKLTVFFVVKETALGITPINPDGMMRLSETDPTEYPYYAFSDDNNPNDNDVPGTIYCYFERNISFGLEPGSDFYVKYEILPVIDQHDISYAIDPPKRSDQDADEGDDEREGGSTNDDPEGNDNGDGSTGNEEISPGGTVPIPIQKPGN